jgi:Myb-like DNA-binding domain
VHNCCVYLWDAGVRRYGRNFSAIAEVLGTKTEAHVRNFFHSSRDQFKLDDALQDYERSCSETVQNLFKTLPAGTQLLVIIPSTMF